MNPMSMTAGLATLSYLMKNPALYDHIGTLAETARKKVDKEFADREIPTRSTGLGSLFQTHFLREDGLQIKNAEDKSVNTLKERQLAYHFMLILDGIFFLPEHEGAISTAHTERDIEELVNSTSVIAEEMRKEVK